jgi:hypothetical protein
MPSNDNEFPRDDSGAMPGGPDAHGQAALVLVESLIHVLIERDVLTVADSMDVLETALEVQTEAAMEADGHGARMWLSTALLASMATSLRTDLQASPSAS